KSGDYYNWEILGTQPIQPLNLIIRVDANHEDHEGRFPANLFRSSSRSSFLHGLNIRVDVVWPDFEIFFTPKKNTILPKKIPGRTHSGIETEKGSSKGRTPWLNQSGKPVHRSAKALPINALNANSFYLQWLCLSGSTANTKTAA